MGTRSMSTTLNAPAPAPAAAKIDQGPGSAVLRGLPNLVVFSALAGILYFGHRHEWKLPKLSALAGGATQAEDDWCAEHLVPESICVECRPDRLPRAKEFGY